jgi:hypothetical protein
MGWWGAPKGPDPDRAKPGGGWFQRIKGAPAPPPTGSQPPHANGHGFSRKKGGGLRGGGKN